MATGARAQTRRARKTPPASREVDRVAPRHHGEHRALENPGPRLAVVARVHGPAPVARILPEIEREAPAVERQQRSEEHTSELQSRLHLVCRLLLGKKKRNSRHTAAQPET